MKSLESEDQGYKLLCMTDSDAVDNASKERSSALRDRGLDISPAKGSFVRVNGVLANGKARRKVRLKRKQRDNRLSAVIGSSTGSEYASNSDLENDPTGCRCFCFSLSPGRSIPRKPHAHLRPPSRPLPSVRTAVALTVFAVIFVGLSYFFILLQGQVATLSIQLQQVLKGRQNAAESNHRIHAEFASLASNQSQILSDYSALASKVGSLEDQWRRVNASVASLLDSMGAAPYMKSLPGDVEEVKKDVAKFGSRLTEMEAQLSKVESDLRAGLANVRSKPRLAKEGSLHDKTVGEVENLSANRTAKLAAKLEDVDSKLVRFGTEMSRQLRRQEERTTRIWKFIGEIQDDLRNVSAKSLSNDVNIQKLTGRVNGLADRFRSTLSGDVGSRDQDKKKPSASGEADKPSSVEDNSFS